jgi:hypothetical protein
MYWNHVNNSAAAALFVVLAAVGCNQSENKSSRAGEASETKVAQAQEKMGGDSKHSGWWCDEHGVPESMCGQCDAKLAAAFKKKGDWCNEHDRPDSQCFIHHPELKEKFAAMYRAKYGKEPPPMEDEPKKDQKN